MSKFKVGDKAICKKDYRNQFTKGKEYVVTKIQGRTIKTIDDCGDDNGWSIDFFETVKKSFTQQDLKVGMYCEFINNNIVEVPSKSLCDHWKRQDGLIVIYKKDVQGNLIKIWGRYKEKLYELKCPITGLYLYINQLNEYEWEISGSKFTQEEIDNLPNQDLIKVLIKKEN